MAKTVTLHVTEAELDTIGDAIEAYASGIERAGFVLYNLQTARQRSKAASLRIAAMKLRHRLYQQARPATEDR